MRVAALALIVSASAGALVGMACSSAPSPIGARPVCSSPDACVRDCDRGVRDACLRAGDLAATGGDVELELEAAAPAWARACQLGLGLGCERLACVLLRDGQQQAATRELESACQRGSCTLTRACEGAGIATCASHAACAVAAPHADEAACHAGDAAACFALGEQQEDAEHRAAAARGEHHDDATQFAVDAYTRACEGGIAAACVRIGRIDTATRLYRARCQRGQQSACTSEAGLAVLTRSPRSPGPFTLDLWRDVACGGDAPRTPIIAAHCAELTRDIDTWRRDWLARAAPFFAAHRPAQLPATVVLPFGGGDLVTALAVAPDADRFITISLEPATTTLTLPSSARAHQWLERWRTRARRLLVESYSTTRSLELTGVTTLALLGIAAHGCTATAITNASITFTCNGRTKTWRHITADLAAFTPALATELRALGDIIAIAKATGFLLWHDRFAGARDYLLGSAGWIVGDASSIHPDHALADGKRVTVHGAFRAPFETGAPALETRLAAWPAPQPAPPFRFGYGSQIVLIE